MNPEMRVEALLKNIQTLIKNGKKKKVIDGKTFDEIEVSTLQLPTALVDSIDALLEDLKKEHEE